MEIFDKFEKAIDYLYTNNNYLAAEVVKLSYPKFDDAIPTAAVAWDKFQKRTNFIFNKKFYDELDVEQLAFILAHESSHIFNGHIVTLVRELKKFNVKDNHNMTDKQHHFMKKFNIAADCVVNDSLVNLYKMNRCLDKLFQPVYGKETVGFECHDMTAMDLLPLIKDDMVGSGDDHSSWSSFYDANGNLNEDFVKSIKDFLKSKKDNSALSDKESQIIDDLEEKIKNLPSTAGTSPSGTKVPISSLGRDSLSWNNILFDITESKKVEENWCKSPRSMIESYPDVILPSYKEKEVFDLFIAIDTSGSIDMNALKLFLSLVRNTPSNFKIKAITFDTQCYEFDVKKDTEVQGRGGTSFTCIEDYIQKNLRKYPKVVVVLTDGCGDMVNPEKPQNWVFMLYGSSDKSYIPKRSKSYSIEKMMKKN